MERKGQSKLGIASLLISIITAIGLFISTLIAGVMESNTYGEWTRNLQEQLF